MRQRQWSDTLQGQTDERRVLRFGLRQKVIIILTTVLVITLTVNSWLTLQSQERDIYRETHRWGTEFTHFVAQNLLNSVVGYNYHAIELLLKELIKNEDIVYIRVTSAKGNTMAQVGEPGRDSDRLALFMEDIRVDGEVVGRVSLGLSTQRIAANLAQARGASVVRQFLTIFLIMVVEFIALSYFIIRPISVFSHALERGIPTEGRDFEPVPLRSQDELGDMAARFNKLQSELNKANSKLRSKIELADAELRRANEQLVTQADELKRVNRELAEMSVTDPLTGLYNRRYFENLMENEMELSIRNKETNSIILIDIDEFKDLNDQFGHAAGDGIIREIAARIARRIRKTDIACRYGGDEFFVLCRRAGVESAVNVANDLREAATTTPLRVGDLDVLVTLSLGVATVPGEYPIHTTEEFLRCADIALYHCKRQGRNRVVHYGSLSKDKQAYPFERPQYG